jgi:hypothetical protein
VAARASLQLAVQGITTEIWPMMSMTPAGFFSSMEALSCRCFLSSNTQKILPQ